MHAWNYALSFNHVSTCNSKESFHKRKKRYSQGYAEINAWTQFHSILKKDHKHIVIFNSLNCNKNIQTTPVERVHIFSS